MPRRLTARLTKPLRNIWSTLAQLDPRLSAADAKMASLADFQAKIASDIDMLQDKQNQLQAMAQHQLQAIREELQQLRKEAAARTLPQAQGGQITDVLRRHLADLSLDNDDRGQLYRLGLNMVGVLNYENDEVSGERRFISRFLEQFPQALIVDVGANAGQFTQMVHELGPETTIHAFEPHPVSFAALSAATQGTTVRAHQIALSDHAGQIEFFDYADQAGSQHASVYRDVIEAVHRRPASSTQVRCDILDSVAGLLGLGQINLLKIDTEGHELAVLAGARELLAGNRIDVIQFEFNEMNVISRCFMKDFFAALPNYRLYRLLPDGVIEFPQYDPVFMEIFAYQNIACIRRDLDPFWIHPRP